MTIDFENYTEHLNTRAAQQFLQHFLYFGQNQQVSSSIFPFV